MEQSRAAHRSRDRVHYMPYSALYRGGASYSAVEGKQIDLARRSCTSFVHGHMASPLCVPLDGQLRATSSDMHHNWPAVPAVSVPCSLSKDQC